MGIYEKEDVVGYFVRREVVCLECLKDKEEVRALMGDLIFREKLEDKDFFCDRCKKRLT